MICCISGKSSTCYPEVVHRFCGYLCACPADTRTWLAMKVNIAFIRFADFFSNGCAREATVVAALISANVLLAAFLLRSCCGNSRGVDASASVDRTERLFSLFLTSPSLYPFTTSLRRLLLHQPLILRRPLILPVVHSYFAIRSYSVIRSIPSSALSVIPTKVGIQALRAALFRYPDENRNPDFPRRARAPSGLIVSG
jgi:hypothetical protein